MKKNLISILTVLAIIGTLCTSMFTPSLNTYANEISFKSINSIL
ncbi:hypothetical protein ACHM2J_13150 [Clostridium perfringens]|nr:hypothetical protein [Clostridium perfringens]MDB2061870.1 hypothetical protein [Clostridium perfringens]MDB2064026.1 hypothetical protein [Clostridium perfringens]MDB2066533.1 hypothetical protein [Clostridium perfringens]MDK0899164.1 hypothetical protein [Clostridium perfringens]MDM0903068.1 hypothetical protein [Clostridium perfringens]